MDDVAEVHVYPDVTVRDDTGRFISSFESGLASALEEMAEDGEQIAQELAPVGHKNDFRGPPITLAFYHHADGVSASWGNYAKHAMAQEMGAKEHPITGEVSFYWEKEGRDWHPGKNIIRHPGNPAHPFLRPSYRMIVAVLDEYLRRHLQR